MKLVEDWKNWPKRWSTWCELAAASFFSALLIAPDAVMHVWLVLPADVRAAIPEGWIKWAGLALIAAGSLAKIIDQPKLKGKIDGQDN